jgi:hypothetical protein
MDCSEVQFPTQIFVDSNNTSLLNCLGIFSFLPDQYTDPSSDEICPLNVKILINCKNDLKLSLLDNNGCILDTLIIKCGQYKIVDVIDIYEQVFNSPKNYVIAINGRNLNLMGEYVSFEEKAYYYRRVKQAYTNLWCGLESTSILYNIVNNYIDTPQSLALDLLKARVVALKQLCEVGKVCNSNFPPHPSTCSSFKKCCN